MMASFYVTQASAMEGKPNYFYSPADSKTANTVINAAIKAAGAVATEANPSIVYIEPGTYFISDHIWFTPNGNPKRSSSTQVAPAYPCNYVIVQGVNTPKIKIAAGLDASKWGGSNNYDRLGMIFMYGAKNVKLSNMILDGSYDDLYAGKANFTYGQSKMDAIVQYSCTGITAELITVINGACDAFLVAVSSKFTAIECLVDHCGHDAFQCYASSDVLVDRCRVGIRSNCGFRWAGDSTRGEVRNSEFWTALGGASAFELQNAASNLKIHHNYIHDVNGNGKYGGIGYPGQSPSGSGHEYYNNIIVDCVFGISDNIPSSAVIRKNIVLNCSLTSKGIQSGNIKSTSGYTIQKYGTKKKGDTYWKVTGGSLIEEIIGIIPKETPVTPPVDPDNMKSIILQMTSTLENSDTQLHFNYAENLKDGRGITFGCIGFCTGTYDGNILIKHYTKLNPNNPLAKYIPALDKIDAAPHNSAGGDGNPSVEGLDGFINAVETCNDPLFKTAQLDKLDELYYNPAMKLAESAGIKYPLTKAFIYDMCVRHGADGAEDLIKAAGSVGSNEKTFLSKLISLRDAELKQEGLGDVDRDTGFKNLLNGGNVNLVTPFTFVAYGYSFTIKETQDVPVTKPVSYKKYSDPDGKSHAVFFPELTAEKFAIVLKTIDSVRV